MSMYDAIINAIYDSANKVAASGGGGGTTNYNNLSNKPSINNVTLSGDKSTSDLGIDEVPEVTVNDDGKVLKASYTGGVGSYSWQTSGGGGGGTSDYSDLENKPQINSVTLSGNKTTSDLGIDAVPTVGSGDNGKVLTAAYSSDTGSYSWTALSVSAANVSGLATVATSGAYSDLTGTPTIPTVPITEIQKNGTAISPVSGVVNITVPTSAADVSALPASTAYAGASTAGGSATSAAKLDNSTDAGSTTQPVYFSSGVPTATTYSLSKSVPADAVFTDTTYGYASQNTAGLVRAWTTTDGTSTTLHIATEAPTP